MMKKYLFLSFFLLFLMPYAVAEESTLDKGTKICLDEKQKPQETCHTALEPNTIYRFEGEVSNTGGSPDPKPEYPEGYPITIEETDRYKIVLLDKETYMFISKSSDTPTDIRESIEWDIEKMPDTATISKPSEPQLVGFELAKDWFAVGVAFDELLRSIEARQNFLLSLGLITLLSIIITGIIFFRYKNIYSENFEQKVYINPPYSFEFIENPSDPNGK